MLLDMRKRLDAIQQDENPFVAVPAKERGPSVRWVQPRLVAQVQFTGWTADGVLRHPSFQGLREDKPAAAVTRPESLPPGKEREAKMPASSATKSRPRSKSKNSVSRLRKKPAEKARLAIKEKLGANLPVKLT